jgi:hypothetical protein
MHLQPARAERARPAAVRSELVERRTSAEAKSEGALERGSGRAEGAEPRESGRPPRARSAGSEPSEQRGEQ